jgi:hypothetical protein
MWWLAFKNNNLQRPNKGGGQDCQHNLYCILLFKTVIRLGRFKWEGKKSYLLTGRLPAFLIRSDPLYFNAHVLFWYTWYTHTHTHTHVCMYTQKAYYAKGSCGLLCYHLEVSLGLLLFHWQLIVIEPPSSAESVWNIKAEHFHFIMARLL